MITWASVCILCFNLLTDIPIFSYAASRKVESGHNNFSYFMHIKHWIFTTHLNKATKQCTWLSTLSCWLKLNGMVSESRYLIMIIALYSSIMLETTCDEMGASVNIVPTNMWAPQNGWRIHLQQPRSTMSKPKCLNRSSVSHSVELE